MGLKDDIKSAFLTSMGNPKDEDGNPIEGNIEQLSKDLTDAVIDFLTKQTFTITEMKAVLEVEKMTTTGPYQSDVLPTVMVGAGLTTMGSPVTQTTALPFPLVGGKGGVLNAPLKLDKRSGTGGSMRSKGHAYIGNNPVDRSETNEDLTKVKLLRKNIVEM